MSMRKKEPEFSQMPTGSKTIIDDIGAEDEVFHDGGLLDVNDSFYINELDTTIRRHEAAVRMQDEKMLSVFREQMKYGSIMSRPAPATSAAGTKPVPRKRTKSTSLSAPPKRARKQIDLEPAEIEIDSDTEYKTEKLRSMFNYDDSSSSENDSDDNDPSLVSAQAALGLPDPYSSVRGLDPYFLPKTTGNPESNIESEISYTASYDDNHADSTTTDYTEQIDNSEAGWSWQWDPPEWNLEFWTPNLEPIAVNVDEDTHDADPELSYEPVLPPPLPEPEDPETAKRRKFQSARQRRMNKILQSIEGPSDEELLKRQAEEEKAKAAAKAKELAEAKAIMQQLTPANQETRMEENSHSAAHTHADAQPIQNRTQTMTNHTQAQKNLRISVTPSSLPAHHASTPTKSQTQTTTPRRTVIGPILPAELMHNHNNDSDSDTDKESDHDHQDKDRKDNCNHDKDKKKSMNPQDDDGTESDGDSCATEPEDM